MLQTIRDKITGGFAAVFLGAIGVVFVFWGIDFQSRADTFAAEVNGEVIQMDTVRRAWQQQQQGKVAAAGPGRLRMGAGDRPFPALDRGRLVR